MSRAKTNLEIEKLYPLDEEILLDRVIQARQSMIDNGFVTEQYTQEELDKRVVELRKINRFFRRCEEIEIGEIGFMSRTLVQAFFPYKDPKDTPVWLRSNGKLHVSITPVYTTGKDGKPVSSGIPYGNIPRLVLAYLTTEVVRSQERQICLGETLADFMRQLGLEPSGGRWGTITRLRIQIKRLFSANIDIIYEDDNDETYQQNQIKAAIASKHSLWWDKRNIDQAALPGFESYVLLSNEFFEEIINYPVPINMDVLRALKHHPQALDIYCWLTYRVSYLNKSVRIPWDILSYQFGSQYSEIKAFKRFFVKSLEKVKYVYKDLNVEVEKKHFVIHPSRPHVPKKIQVIK